MAIARADTTEAKPTADQMRVLKILEQLVDAADWQGVAAQEHAARAVAAAPARLRLPTTHWCQVFAAIEARPVV